MCIRDSYSGDWGERHDEELTGDAAQQTSGEAGEQAQAVDYASLPLDAEGYPCLLYTSRCV